MAAEEQGGQKRTETSQGNTMEQCTTPVPLPQRQTKLGRNREGQSVPANPEEPSRVELLAAIRSGPGGTRDNGQMDDTEAQASATDSAQRVVIEQDGTKAVVNTGMEEDLNGQLERGAERVPAQMVSQEAHEEKKKKKTVGGKSVAGLLALLPPVPPPGHCDEGRAPVFGFLLLVLASFPWLPLPTSLRLPLLGPLHFSAVWPHVVLLPLVLSLRTGSSSPTVLISV
ncbi:hypothetical protein NDU88_008501 [Pleurodeles waltl]|uniref:Uncharacterized protein n=1 Tax=Pleurodeles waltl TaxID=8319 RepID=A0AAV7PWT9_PLEWA|nr:hypothetical protein NDU88_008501 [Pleurodeles waltl]